MNTHELISHLREDAETAGAYVALNSRVISGDVRGRLRLCVEGKCDGCLRLL